MYFLLHFSSLNNGLNEINGEHEGHVKKIVPLFFLLMELKLLAQQLGTRSGSNTGHNQCNAHTQLQGANCRVLGSNRGQLQAHT